MKNGGILKNLFKNKRTKTLDGCEQIWWVEKLILLK